MDKTQMTAIMLDNTSTVIPIQRIKATLEVEYDQHTGWMPEHQKHVLKMVMRQTRNDAILYDVVLMYIDWPEFKLKGGRFARFVNEQYFPCWSQTTDIPYMWENGQRKFEDLINWIAENTEGLWSLRVVPHSVSNIVLQFAFAFDSNIDAVHFALRWR